MVSYFEIDGQKIEIPNDCAFTCAHAWTTQERRSSDGTGTAQSIALMERAGRQPATVQISFTVGANMADDMFEQWAAFDSLVGASGLLVYSGRAFGRYIVTDGSFTVLTDGVLGFRGVSVSLNLRENAPVVPGERGTIQTRFI